MADYDDLIAQLNTLESDWGGREAMPDELGQTLDRARACLVDHSLVGAANYLTLLQQELPGYNPPGDFALDLALVIQSIEESE